MFGLIALELVGHPEQRAENGGAVVAGQVHDTGFDDEATEFDEVPRALTTFDLPRAHVMSRPCGLATAERMSVEDSARFMALVAVGLSDAVIALFDAKYYYNFWRPITAIRKADIDENPATERRAT
jgi:hypothetical protein